jgi:hypothetical protein
VYRISKVIQTFVVNLEKQVLDLAILLLKFRMVGHTCYPLKLIVISSLIGLLQLFVTTRIEFWCV